ncbi:hypothetical protein P5673_020062 [Acropora cervicornis]|uniref:Uncharacterized protein n=1 Tax=Acropora cervicornis TaxID=6130 RepID=A0AAD9QAF1_ACRCE|nr:hypothetical protein P5673_020062 [Acropora cervicornis]
MASEPGVEVKDVLYLWDPALTNISAFKVVLTAPSKCLFSGHCVSPVRHVFVNYDKIMDLRAGMESLKRNGTPFLRQLLHPSLSKFVEFRRDKVLGKWNYQNIKTVEMELLHVKLHEELKSIFLQVQISYKRFPFVTSLTQQKSSWPTVLLLPPRFGTTIPSLASESKDLKQSLQRNKQKKQLKSNVKFHCKKCRSKYVDKCISMITQQSPVFKQKL